MSDFSAYRLLDFGNGRRLEQFSDVVVDRPCPAAVDAVASHPAAWRDWTARFEKSKGDSGKWRCRGDLPDDWSLECDGFSLRLRLAPFGHVGVFPEQFDNWQWIRRQVARADEDVKVLNLFAYSGASTLAAASAGAAVTHVDASRPTVQLARENAVQAGLADAPIRWIVDDASQFVQRELRRGNTYHAVILDPPSYGHGPKGEPWKIHQHLLPLLRNCARLTESKRLFVLLTAHSPGLGPSELSAMLKDAFFGHCQVGVSAKPAQLTAIDGRRLNAGMVARWPDR